MPTLDLAEMTWPEVEAAIADGFGVIQPVGATEQHGLHLPLITDTLLATELAHAVAAETKMLVAPTIAHGYRSRPQVGGGQCFVGTTSLSGTTLIALVRDILTELLRHGFTRICLLNWHMENTNFLYEGAFLAMEKAAADVKLMVVESPFDQLSESTTKLLFDDDFPGWAVEHAGVLETSLLQYLRPDLVRADRIEDGVVERRVTYDVLPFQPDLISTNGALWKGTLGSAEKGRCAWDEIVTPLRAAVHTELPLS